ncbi:MFS transporter, FHS family, Na+ dependent glucose transporter 1 [Mytilus galloprovincialis]|uniref:MFS transporter, FHS family, Na+ dependent glucose transporter 1 n=1 Tax=Mytilus galloprovincialis TaxID=29158 RepID=A0A8B6FMZ6_MYTGA|nr:MFS transporter, FHS family, Na+ dependent glucose transporter 1 [Mytilus galloprovincialis]
MLECNVVVLKNCFRLCVIYRPPPSRTNKLKNSTFFEEWSEFLDRLVVTPEELVITGDLNFHLDNKNNCDTRKFQETLRDHGLVQHVRGPTHNHGHTLDVVITRENSLILKTVPSVQDPSLCDRKGNPSGDHLALFSALEISKPPRERKEVTYRKLRNISTDDIIHDLVNSEIFQNQERPLEDLVNLYSTELSSILDKHAPLISKNLILRPNTEWYTDDLRVAKRNRRKAERRMRKTKLTIHRQMFRESCITTNQLLIKCKKDYFSSKISEIGHDQKQLHRLTNDLMGNKREIFLPEHEDDKLLADKFCEFFVGKISIIRDSLSTTNTSSSDSNPMRADIKFEEISGTTQKDLIIKTNSDYELVSRAISGRSFGYFIGSFIGGPLVDKLGNYCDLMIAISLDGAAIATIIAPYSSNVGMLGVLLVIGGTFEGVINIAGQKLILNLWKRKATGPLHILHFGFGMGSFIVPQIANPFLAVLAPSLDITNASSINGTKSPFVIDPVTVTATTTNNTIAVIFLKESKIESAYLIVSIIVASLSVVFFLYQFCNRTTVYTHVHVPGEIKESNFRKAVKLVDPATCADGNRCFGVQIFLLIFLYFFNAVGGERMYSKFIRSYAIDKHKFSGDDGSLINTTFWICFAIGRLTGLLTGRFIPVRILIVIEASGVLVTAILLEIFARENDLALWVLTCPMGFFLSQLFPTGIGWGDFHVEFTGIAITFALMGGALGGVSYLWVLGYLYEYQGYDMFLHQLVFYGGCMMFFTIIMTIVGIKHGGRFERDTERHTDENAVELDELDEDITCINDEA